MKSKILKKARIASAVMLATATMAAGTAQADSILAPFVVNDDANNIETYISLRSGVQAGGNFLQNFEFNNLHYYWIQKNWDPADTVTEALLENPMKECRVTNTFGTVTPRDMLYQTTYGNGTFNGDLFGFDFSQSSAWPTDYLGMLALDITPALGVEEGNFTGFTYIVDTNNAIVLDYKMLNNHRSTKSGDFSAGFMSKKSIDYSWWPTLAVNTFWYTAVMSDDMTAGAEQAPNSRYDATVLIGSDARVELDGTFDQDSPQDFLQGKGVYDNDENFLSGAVDLKITCLHAYQREGFMTATAELFTDFGGHTRRSITPVAGKSIDATGAITYKLETAVGALPLNAFTIETSGHLTTGNNKANRPY